MIGFAPQQVDAMSLYQHAACIDGWNRAHDTDGDAATSPTAEEFERMKQLHGDA